MSTFEEFLRSACESIAKRPDNPAHVVAMTEDGKPLHGGIVFVPVGMDAEEWLRQRRLDRAERRRRWEESQAS